MQRLRVTFSRGEQLKYLSHLDVMRLWERALRRAALPLSYSQGFSPHPRISIAAPLPLGVTGENELMDIVFRRRVSPYSVQNSLAEQLPSGMDIIGVTQVPPDGPSLQSQVRRSEYRVEIESDKPIEAIKGSIDSFLALESLPWHHKRDDEMRSYDLRKLVDRVWLIEARGAEYVLGMCLRTDGSASGRAEQVTLALGFEGQPKSICRTRLYLAGE
ncbi:MAG: TIGR03936 family radical SAM-associated protein [Dehalococcoidia bacterium]|jgi:radical SAM-linked protein